MQAKTGKTHLLSIWIVLFIFVQNYRVVVSAIAIGFRPCKFANDMTACVESVTSLKQHTPCGMIASSSSFASPPRPA